MTNPTELITETNASHIMVELPTGAIKRHGSLWTVTMPDGTQVTVASVLEALRIYRGNENESS